MEPVLAPVLLVYEDPLTWTTDPDMVCDDPKQWTTSSLALCVRLARRVRWLFRCAAL